MYTVFTFFHLTLEIGMDNTILYANVVHISQLFYLAGGDTRLISQLEEIKMTVSTSTVSGSDTQSKNGKCCGFDGKANWSGANIVAMIIGFVLFWPIGLFLLFWIMTGRDVLDLPAAIADKWRQFKGNQSSKTEVTDNEVFNDYQQTQYDRIREIKEEIKSRAKRFTEFRSAAKRRADEEEFRQFMDDTPS